MKKISKRVQDLLSTASPKQKAILICLENLDKKNTFQEPTITDEEVEAIKKSIKIPEESKVFLRWLNYYNVYTHVATRLGLAYAEYRSAANETAGYLRLIDQYKQEEAHLNTILQDIKDYYIDKDRAERMFWKSIGLMSFKDAKVRKTNEGYVEIDAKEIFFKAASNHTYLTAALSALKGVIMAIEEWTAKKRCRAMMPFGFKAAIEWAKEDYSLTELPQYSRKMIKERLDRGENVTPSEIKRAIFPYYDEVDPDPEILKGVRQDLTDYEGLYLNITRRR